MNNIHKLTLIAAFAVATSTLTNCSSGGGGNDDPPPSSSSAVGTSSGGGSSSSAGSSSSVSLCGTEAYDPANSNLRCESNVLETKCGSAWYNAANTNLRCEANIIETKCGTGWYNAATQFCYNSSKVGNKCGARTEVFDPDLYECRESSKIYLKTKPADPDGNEYEAVLIGEQTWMAENLNFNVAGSKCYEEDDDYCADYGRLYNLSAALAGAASSDANPSGVQGVCPSGWHLPSEAEWTVLTNYIESNNNCSSCAGKYLKAESVWDSDGAFGPGKDGTDAYGFAALPGGQCTTDGTFRNITSGFWWSATKDSGWGRGMNMYYYSDKVNWLGYEPSYFHNVRCVKD